MEYNFFTPLEVSLTEKKGYNYDEESVMPAHELVIRPLLEKSIDTFIYRGTKEEFFLYGKVQVPIALEKIDILIPDKGKFKFDKSKECILGYEYLWNARVFKRGSIVFLIEEGQINFAELFRHTYRPGLLGTPNSGNTPSATKKCREAAKQGLIAVCLTASNGLEWISIYARQETFDNILKQAEDHCQDNN